LQYIFEWDQKKNRGNIRKHQLSFQRASTIFRDLNQISIYDDDHSEGEDRWVTIGIDSGGTLRVVVHTFASMGQTANRIRIISARKATKAETIVYKQG